MSRPACRRFFPLGLPAVALVMLGAVSALAVEEPTSFVLDFPVPQNLATPSWLGHPATPTGAFAVVEIPVTPPDATAALLVTASFEEKEGGFLRVIWQSAQGAAQTLSDNLEEGVNMPNQRSLLVSADTLQGAGLLRFQSSELTSTLTHLRLEWVETKNALVSPEVQELLVTAQNGLTRPASALDGQPPVAADGSWRGRVVEVPLTDTPQRIEQGVDFSVQLDGVPKAARLVVAENGLALDQHLVVWVNGQRAGLVSPGVPSLDDIGFTTTSDTSSFIGWREGSVLLPVTLFEVGANTVEFSTEMDNPKTDSVASASAAPLPLAIKNLVLQMEYTDPADAVPPAAATTNTPTAISPTSP